MNTVEKWGVFEVSAQGVSDGNPFTERTMTAVFTGAHERVTVNGFYDGDGVYRVRFMPSYEGEYTYTIAGSYGGGPVQGSFTVLPALARFFTFALFLIATPLPFFFVFQPTNL